MHITNELIEKFFHKKCTQDEAQEVMDYLINHQEIFDKYLSKSEWDQEIINDYKTEEFWEVIWHEIKPNHEKKKRKDSFLKYAIAASFIASLVVFVSIYFSKKIEHEKVQQQVTKVFKHKVIKNTSKVVKEVTLEDGSVVKLNLNAKIEYNEPFQHNKRDIYLEGEALFNVAKDKMKPFTVFTSHISTTALGTQFKVISNENSDQIIVHLYEGKVVVKSTLPTKKNFYGNFYLFPGDELTYNKLTSSAKVTRKIYDKEKSQNQLLVFDKEPLSDVFDQLASKYDVHIQYSNVDFEHRYYIGSFDRTDSIQDILTNITKLNELKLIKNNNNEYVITKK